MAINWNFNADDYEERSFDLIPVRQPQNKSCGN